MSGDDVWRASPRKLTSQDKALVAALELAMHWAPPRRGWRRWLWKLAVSNDYQVQER
jgi:hypothetical protein